MKQDAGAGILKAAYRVLAVDDDADILAAYRSSLAPPEDPARAASLAAVEQDLFDVSAPGDISRPSEFELSCADNGDAAVRTIRTAHGSDRPFAAVLMDRSMPVGIDGIEAIDAIRRFDREIITVLVTGDRDHTTLQRIKRFEADDRFFVFFKPFYPVELRQFLGSVCAKARLERALRDLNSALEDKVRDRTRELQQAKARAEAASEAKSRFLSNMSHEFRTPLNGILGSAEVLGMSDMPDRERENLDAIRKCGRWLLDFLDKTLDLSLLDEGRVKPSLTNCAPDVLVEDAVAQIAQAAAQKGLEIRIDIDHGTVPSIQTDARLLTQAIASLLSNAVKFTETGEIVVVVGPFDEHDLTISVTDTGPGIAEEDRAKIFNRFFQGQRSDSNPVAGAGLGLAITRETIDLLGGQIVCDSTPGRGTTFTIRLPLDARPGAERL